MIYIYDKPAQSTPLQAAVANGNQVSPWFLAGQDLTEVPQASTDAQWQMVSPQVPLSVGVRDKCTDGEGLVSKFPGTVVCSLVFVRTE